MSVLPDLVGCRAGNVLGRDQRLKNRTMSSLTSRRRFTMVAIYRNAYSGVDTISHLLEKPLAEREMRRKKGER